jgi:hypothetical protein
LESSRSIRRTVGGIEKMRREGGQTMSQLGRQTETLVRARENLRETHSINERARQVIGAIGMHLWRDRFTQYAIIFVELLIIGMLIYIKYIEPLEPREKR